MRETEKLVLFWTARDIFSNFYHSPFKHDGKTFQWSEQAIMYRKAKLFNSPKHIIDAILNAESPQQCKKLGRSREIPFDNDVWETHRERVYYEVLRDKFELPQLKEKLLSTENKTLAEASPYDNIWGIGMGELAVGVENPSNWKGLNLLGKVLMRVREDIRDEEGYEIG